MTLSYYTGPFGVDDAVTQLVDQHGRTLATVTGQMCWHPEIDKITRNEWGGFSGEEPRYVIMRTKDTIEVFDHPPVAGAFPVTDDPVLVREATDSIRRGECRKQ